MATKKSTKKPASKKGARSTKSTAKKATEKAAPKASAKATAKARDPRLPAPGGVIEKVYKGKTLEVEVLEVGFRFEGKEWRSLSALAMAITGAKSINGPLFFRLGKPTPQAVAPAEAPPAADQGR